MAKRRKKSKSHDGKIIGGLAGTGAGLAAFGTGTAGIAIGGTAFSLGAPVFIPIGIAGFLIGSLFD